MEIPKTLTVQYSNSNFNKLNNSNSTVTFNTVRSNLTDVMPDEKFAPFYAAQYKKLGYKRFMELANEARRLGKSPERLFVWMLKNNECVVVEN